jgi:hypothetical protein
VGYAGKLVATLGAMPSAAGWNQAYLECNRLSLDDHAVVVASPAIRGSFRGSFRKSRKKLRTQSDTCGLSAMPVCAPMAWLGRNSSRYPRPEYLPLLPNFVYCRTSWHTVTRSTVHDRPLAFVDVELHDAFIPHFQQQGLACFIIHDVGALFYLEGLEGLFAKRAQNMFSII